MLRSGITETFDELASMVSVMKLCARRSLNDTTCHRLTTASSLGVLRCGDPTGLARPVSVAVPRDMSPPTAGP